MVMDAFGELCFSLNEGFLGYILCHIFVGMLSILLHVDFNCILFQIYYGLCGNNYILCYKFPYNFLKCPLLIGFIFTCIFDNLFSCMWILIECLFQIYYGLCGMVIFFVASFHTLCVDLIYAMDVMYDYLFQLTC